MIFNKLKNYFNNLSIEQGIPKFIFIFLYVFVLTIGLLFFRSIDLNYRNSYTQFFEKKVLALEYSIDALNLRNYESYYEVFSHQFPENSQIKNIVFILWDSKGKVLWHSNRLIEKIVEKDEKLFNESNLLDIPEKNFKPYDTFKSKHDQLMDNFVSTEFQKNTVLHLYKMPGTKKDVYVEILREFEHVVPAKIYLYLIICSLFFSGVLTYLVKLLIKTYLNPIHHLQSSIEHFISKGPMKPVHYFSENEIGKLIHSYNDLSTKPEDCFDDMDGKNKKVIDFLQQMLIKKSIRKSDQIELLLYPRLPESDFRMFVTIEENANTTYILYVHFDINNIESNLEKHIVQDRFKENIQKLNDIHDISEELFKDLVVHADLGPGFLLIRICGKDLEWVRSGPFQLFIIDEVNGNSESLNGGLDYLPADTIQPESRQLENQFILIISNDILALLNMNEDEFSNEVIQLSNNSLTGGKEVLADLLNNISNLNPEVVKQSPMMSLIRLKSTYH